MAGLDSIPGDHRLGWRMHRVETGETLGVIAKRYGATPASIVSANHMLATDQPAPGDRLIIPAAYHEPPAPRATIRRSARTTRPRTVASTVHPASAKPAAGKTVTTTPVRKTAAVVKPAAKLQPKG